MKTFRITVIGLLLVLLLAACSGQKADLPPPSQLFAALQADLSLPEMSEVSAYMLEENTGISSEHYQEAVYYILEAGMSPDQIIIILAKDEPSAKAMEEQLQSWLDHQIKSSQTYLTEYMPLLQAGVIRRDGLTVSLIVSPFAEKIVSLYEKFN